MDPITWLQQNLGLVVFSVISAALIVYLGYAMVRPERF
jgi:K+-transporting ATPase KdpF subunit